MNRIKLLAAICILFLLESCKREQGLPLLPRNGIIYAQQNDKTWSSTVNKVKYSRKDQNKFWLGATIYENGIERQAFSIDEIDLFDSCQKIFSSDFSRHFFDPIDKIVATSLFTVLDGDAVYDFYHPTDSANNNFVTVDSYDTVTRRVRGRFSVKVYRELGSQYMTGFGDTVTFTNGVYDVVIDEP